MTDYINTLLEARNGKVAADINAKFTELVAAIMETGKSGKISVTLAVKPSRVANHRVVEVAIAHDCKISKPEQEIGEAVFFLTPTGELSRVDPAQEEMFEIAKERQ